MTCPRIMGIEDNRTDEDKFRACQECPYYKNEYGMYICKYNETKKEENDNE